MIQCLTIRLYPTEEQEIIMKKHIGCMRYIYNWALAQNKELYEKQKKKYTLLQLSKKITELKKEEEFKWLKEVSTATLKEAIRNLDKAYNNFYKKRANLPKFKSKKRSKLSFYTRYDKVNFFNDVVKLEKLGKIKYKSSYNINLTTINKFSNPTVVYTGRCWVLKLGIQKDLVDQRLNENILGIDFNFENFITVSQKDFKFLDINKTESIKNLEKKFQKLQKKYFKKYDTNKKLGINIKTNNITKIEKKIRKTYRKLKNIRLNYIHKTSNILVKTKPKAIVIKEMNVSNLIKNKYLAKYVQKQEFGTFINQIKYKCMWNGITLIQVPENYPSIKTCSNCGNVKDIKRFKKIYECSCGFKENKYKNSSYNLVNYALNLE